MNEQEYTLRRDLYRDALRKARAEVVQMEQELEELEQEWQAGESYGIETRSSSVALRGVAYCGGCGDA